MNISELARKLKINPNELRIMLPEMGFDVGQKAIQVDNKIAQKIIDNWRELQRKWRFEKDKARDEVAILSIKSETQEKREVRIPKTITVKEFSVKLGVPVNSLMKILMKNGVLASLNDRIDFETASIIGDDLGAAVVSEKETLDLESGSEERVEEAIRASSNLEVRSPVVVVMGHVDHGKTKILDTIRQTNVVAGEAGGITQHIGAYEAIKNNRQITFIDTPGHEAFTAMRSRGAKIADIAILVVAADDGVQPQTREVIDIITAAKLPFVVAINKMDKPEADPEKVKRELAELNLIPEDWGGKTICVPVSAKSGDGIDSLLDTILLVADMEAATIVADKNGETVASVIESNVNKNEGITTTLLVQNGTLRINDYLKIGNILYGRVRAMKDWKGGDIREAGPSKPIKLLGLKLAPEVGDVLTATENIKGLEKNIKKTASKRPTVMAFDSKASSEETKEKEILNIILKTDVLGSAEAIAGSLEQFSHSRIGVKIISSGLGNITEADVLRGEASKASVYGFNVRIDSSIEEFAREKKVDVKTYQIIYELLDDIEEKLQGMLGAEIIRTDLGKLKVLAIFRQDKEHQIIGGRVTEGKIAANAKFDIIKSGVKMDVGSIVRLQAGKQDVSEAVSPSECGMQVKSRQKIEEGDILAIYKEDKKEEKIKL
ncbi:MAG: translation initiation factor IF-2 [Patescibacteria group bacterium]